MVTREDKLEKISTRGVVQPRKPSPANSRNANPQKGNRLASDGDRVEFVHGGKGELVSTLSLVERIAQVDCSVALSLAYCHLCEKVRASFFESSPAAYSHERRHSTDLLFRTVLIQPDCD